MTTLQVSMLSLRIQSYTHEICYCHYAVYTRSILCRLGQGLGRDGPPWGVGTGDTAPCNWYSGAWYMLMVQSQCLGAPNAESVLCSMEVGGSNHPFDYILTKYVYVIHILIHNFPGTFHSLSCYQGQNCVYCGSFCGIIFINIWVVESEKNSLILLSLCSVMQQSFE